MYTRHKYTHVRNRYWYIGVYIPDTYFVKIAVMVFYYTSPPLLNRPRNVQQEHLYEIAGTDSIVVAVPYRMIDILVQEGILRTLVCHGLKKYSSRRY